MNPIDKTSVVSLVRGVAVIAQIKNLLHCAWSFAKIHVLSLNERNTSLVVFLALYYLDSYISIFVELNLETASLVCFTSAQIIGTLIGFLVATLIFRMQDITGQRLSICRDIMARCEKIDAIFSEMPIVDRILRDDLRKLREESINIFELPLDEFSKSSNCLKEIVQSLQKRIQHSIDSIEISARLQSSSREETLGYFGASQQLTSIALSMVQLTQLSYHAIVQEFLVLSIRFAGVNACLCLIFGMFCGTTIRLDYLPGSPLPLVGFSLTAVAAMLFRLASGLRRMYRHFVQSWNLPGPDWIQETPFA